MLSRPWIGRGFIFRLARLTLHAEWVSRKEWTLSLWHRRDAEGRGRYWFDFGPGVIPF